jgi:hypothetical protein
MRARVARHAGAVAAYGVMALAFTWPLVLHLSTRLTGSPGGDTGVYVWNTWVFRHEIVEHGRFPFFTNEIFSLTPRVDLSLHNYTTFANLLAFPLIPHLGVVASFNVVYLLTTVVTGYAMFLLVLHVTRRPVESWLAGLLFAWSPVLVARGTAHFSLVAAAPLPAFVLLMLRAAETQRPRFAVGAGLAVAWAAFSDVYYAVYCVMLGIGILMARALDVRAWSPESRSGVGARGR